MREIGLFRGKRKDNGAWVEGYYSKHKSEKVFIKEVDGDAKGSFEVYPETVDEFTGFRDASMRRIWEGDLVKYHLGEYSYAIVKFKDGKFVLNWLNNEALKEDLAYWVYERDIYVCGNVYDNKKDVDEILDYGELLEREENEI